GVVGRIPLWMVALAVARDVIIVTGAVLLRTLRGIHRFSPSLLGKVSTFFQIVLVLMVLVHAAYPDRFNGWLALAALAFCAFFTVLSGAEYIRRGIALARRRIPARR
ncbi:MAG: CDP-alcohol phosphatidyltransferase family protein, partial [Bryobacteraceae bacterium]